jgi:hypothetical protein
MTPEVRPRAIQLNYPLGVGPFFLTEGGASLRRVPYSAVSAFRARSTAQSEKATQQTNFGHKADMN